MAPPHTTGSCVSRAASTRTRCHWLLVCLTRSCVGRGRLEDATNMDALLSTLTFLPILIVASHKVVTKVSAAKHSGKLDAYAAKAKKAAAAARAKGEQLSSAVTRRVRKPPENAKPTMIRHSKNDSMTV